MNIFELGLKKFNTVLKFVLEYIKFLIKQNDVRIQFLLRVPKLFANLIILS